MVFVELTTDAFDDIRREALTEAGRRRRAGSARARRPMRGLEIKDDTYAVLRVIAADGREIPLLDSSSASGESSSYTNFILQSVSESRMEKNQIVDTFGEAYIYFFGEAPRFLDIRALLLNSFDFNWEAEFWANYNLYFRGTRLVEMGARVYLFYDDNVVEGYMLLAQATKVSEVPLSVELSFRLFVSSYSNISFVGNANFPVRTSIQLPPDVSLTSADAFDVGQVAVNAALVAAMREARTDAQGGAVNASDMRGIAQNALETLFGTSNGVGVRHAPLRGRIADNLDEFTAPPATHADTGQATEARAGQAEAPGDLPTTVSSAASPWGVNLGNPETYRQLGLAPAFVGGTAGATFGAFAGASVGAAVSLGASAVGGAAATLQGISSSSASLALGAPGAWRAPDGFVQGFAPGGSGFAGPFGSAGLPGAGRGGAEAMALAPGPNLLGTPLGFGAPAGAAAAPPFGRPGYGVPGYPPPAYGAPAYAGAPAGFSGAAYIGGVQVGGGLAGGVGIGGGFADAVPHPFGTITGLPAFRAPSSGLQGQGASVSVSGSPSCFATIAVAGTLPPRRR